ncbi:MAG: secretin N-terminal domain-containing protein, partial [Pseudomonadota bacterium]
MVILNNKKERNNQPNKVLLFATLFLTFTLMVSCAASPRSVDGGSLLSKFRKSKVESKEVTTKSPPKAIEPQQLTTKISSSTPTKSEALEKNQSPNWQAGGAQKMTGTDSGASPNLQWSNGRVSFSFENAPIAVVIEGVLHGGLGLGYTIDPEVTGSVTLRTSRPLARDDVIASLDRALWVEGVVLMQNPDGSYLVTTAAKAPSVAPAPRNASAVIRGGGTIIVPLQYVSVENISSILEGLGKKDAVAHIDSDRQLIILRGNQTTLQNTVETINLFDVDWLRSASFRFYEIRWTDPDTLIAELTALMGGQQGPVGRQVDFVSLPRLNGLVVICKRPERQTEISEWISRLDRPARGGNEKRLFHRWIINQDAEVIAETLNKLFSNVAQNQIAGQRRNERNQDQNSGPNNVNSNQAAAPTQSRTIANRVEGTAQQPTPSNPRQGTQNQSSPGDDSNHSVPSITADAATNALLIYATDDEYRQIDEVINRLDLTPDQVMIEATIAEVVLNDQLKYGVQWFIDQNNGHSVTFSGGTDN